MAVEGKGITTAELLLDISTTAVATRARDVMVLDRICIDLHWRYTMDKMWSNKK